MKMHEDNPLNGGPAIANDGSNETILKLSLGDTIDNSSLRFHSINRSTKFYFNSYLNAPPSRLASQFLKPNSGYIGVNFSIKSTETIDGEETKPHYGWIKVSVNSNNELILESYAYEDVDVDVDNTSIKAGDQGIPTGIQYTVCIS